MKQFEYVIKSELGIHARPAGLIAKAAQSGNSVCILTKDGKNVDLKKVFALMAMGVKCGDRIEITVEGDDEDTVFEEIRDLFQKNL